MTVSIMTFSIMTFSIMTFSIMTFSIMALDKKCCYAEFYLCGVSFMQSVINKPFLLSVIMPSVVASFQHTQIFQRKALQCPSLWVYSWPSTNIRLGCKDLPRTNPLPYLSRGSAINKKVQNFWHHVSIFKKNSSSKTLWTNKLECSLWAFSAYSNISE